MCCNSVLPPSYRCEHAVTRSISGMKGFIWLTHPEPTYPVKSEQGPSRRKPGAQIRAACWLAFLAQAVFFLIQPRITYLGVALPTVGCASVPLFRDKGSSPETGEGHQWEEMNCQMFFPPSSINLQYKQICQIWFFPTFTSKQLLNQNNTYAFC